MNLYFYKYVIEIQEIKDFEGSTISVPAEEFWLSAPN